MTNETLRDKIAETAENIMFRRVTQERLVGYTVEASQETADAIIDTIKASVSELVWTERNALLWTVGEYEIINEGDLGFGFYCISLVRFYPTLEAAKAAAQAHHVAQLTDWMDK